MKLIACGLMQESNTFSPFTSHYRNFQNHLLLQGEEMKQLLQINHEVGGFYDAAAEYGAAVVPAFFAAAVSSGKIERESLDRLKRQLLDEVRKHLPCDGILVAMHGAMVAEDTDDVEGEVLAALREAAGASPIALTLDSHANVTRQMVEHVQIIAAYRTFPHIDFRETGHRAARDLLEALQSGSMPVIALRKVPMITPAENQQTSHGPMCEILREAARHEGRNGIRSSSVFSVQPWLDIRELGFSVLTMAAERSQAEAEADRLSKLIWSKRQHFAVQLTQVDDILRMIDEHPERRPYVLSDSADSPGAGSAGDSNYVLRKLIEGDYQRRLHGLLCMVDAPAVDAAFCAGKGKQVELTVGHTIDSTYGQPYRIKGEVVRLGDGEFRFGKGFAENMTARMGRCAVIRLDRVFLLLQEFAVFTGDPAMYRSVGLEPADADFTLVKSANQFRAEYERLSQQIYVLDTPGPSSANLLNMPYVRAERPLFPFDPVVPDFL